MSEMYIQSPWAGLSSYEDPQKVVREGRFPKLFCGRDNESHDVAQLIVGNIFVTLYGKSGTGKTSLLNAGVFPLVRNRQFFPLSIRLSMDAMDTSFQQCIIRKIGEALLDIKGEMQTIDVVPISDDDQTADYLWSYFARSRFSDSEGRTIFPVVVLDQFEEVFRGRSKETEILLRQIAFLLDESHALADRMVGDKPYQYDFNFRFVTAIREDDLYRLEDSIDNNYLGELKRCRYRLRNLTPQGARDAILIPGESLIKDEDKQPIVDAIIGKAKNRDGRISTNIVSLLCSRIYADYQRQQSGFITLPMVEAFINGNPFEQIYNEATLGFSNREKSYIENNLVDSTGRRNSITESDFLHHVKNGAVLLEGEKKILQRISTSSGDESNYRVELIHDAFCEPLLMIRAKRARRYRIGRIIIGFLILGFCALLGMREITSRQYTKSIDEKNDSIRTQNDSIKIINQQLQNRNDSIDKIKQQLQISYDSINEIKQQLENRNDSIKRINRLLDSVNNVIQRRYFQLDSSNQVLTDSLSKDHFVDKLGHNPNIRIIHTGRNQNIPNTTNITDDYIIANSGAGYVAIANNNDNEIIIIESKAGDTLTTLKGYTGLLKSISFAKDGRRIISTSDDNTAIIWDIINGTALDTLKHNGPILSASFSPDGKYIISATVDCVTVWDATTGDSLYSPDLHTKSIRYATFSHKGKGIVWVSTDGTLTYDPWKRKYIR